MADIVRRMLKKGIIQRKRDKDDARAYEVTITSEGTRLYNDVQPIVRRIEDKLLSALNGKRVDEFLSHLGLIVSTARTGDQAVNGQYSTAEAGT
jgi:DNA-binding MarR family transcriptional regulator